MRKAVKIETGDNPSFSYRLTSNQQVEPQWTAKVYSARSAESKQAHKSSWEEPFDQESRFIYQKMKQSQQGGSLRGLAQRKRHNINLSNGNKNLQESKKLQRLPMDLIKKIIYRRFSETAFYNRTIWCAKITYLVCLWKIK